MKQLEEFEKKGIKLEFITQEAGNTPEDRMQFNMRRVFAEYEREKIKERTSRGRRQKAREGKVVNTVTVSYGYRYNKAISNLEEDPERGPLIRMIFHSYAYEDLSLIKLAEKLNRLHVPTPQGGDRWRASSLCKMLRNETYIGTMYHFKGRRIKPEEQRQQNTRMHTHKTSSQLRPREEWIAVKVPALISPGLFEDVQKKLNRNAELAKRNTKREYLLTGLLHCAKCGGKMGGRAFKDVLSYQCDRRYKPDRSCTPVSVRK